MPSMSNSPAHSILKGAFPSSDGWDSHSDIALQASCFCFSFMNFSPSFSFYHSFLAPTILLFFELPAMSLKEVVIFSYSPAESRLFAEAGG